MISCFSSYVLEEKKKGKKKSEGVFIGHPGKGVSFTSEERGKRDFRWRKEQRGAFGRMQMREEAGWEIYANSPKYN